MARYRHALPQLGRELFLTDGGIETTLMFHEGIALEHFAAFTLLKDPERTAVLRTCYSRYVEVARNAGMRLIIETPTWRASKDWGARLNYTELELERANREAVALIEAIRAADERLELIISGCLGPRGDAYAPGERMSVEAARAYHKAQIDILADTEADMLCALTLGYPEEAIGIALAAREAQMPLAIGFTVETDGRLPGGLALCDAIEQVDAQSACYPLYYLINCAHPSHFQALLLADAGPWRARIRGLRANASARSHAELDQASVLDSGDPEVLASQYVELRKQLGHLTIFGGCCGTDHHHIAAMAKALRAMEQT